MTIHPYSANIIYIYTEAMYSARCWLVMELHLKTIKNVEKVTFKSNLEKVDRRTLVHIEGWVVSQGPGYIGKSSFPYYVKPPSRRIEEILIFGTEGHDITYCDNNAMTYCVV